MTYTITASSVDHFPVIPADFFLRLILREHAHSSRLGAPASKPVAPTKLAFGLTRLAIAARILGTFAKADRAVFAARSARAGKTNIFALTAIADGRELLCVAN